MAKKLILFFFVLFISFSVVHANSLIASLDYYKEKIIINNTMLLENNLPKEMRASDYLFKVFSIDNKILEKGYFVIPGPLIIESDFENEIPAETIDFFPKRIEIICSYFPTIKNMILYNGSSSFISIDLSEFNKCNINSICDENENELDCPEDCRKTGKDGLCTAIEDKICKIDPDCKMEDPDCIIQKEKINNTTDEKKIEHFSTEKEYYINNKAKTNSLDNSNELIFYIIFALCVTLMLAAIVIHKAEKIKK
ncbi:MAG: hypothetical protein V1859_06410 [archaeon]